MIDLILTMIVALDDVGGLFLNFTKKDIDNLIKDYGALDKKPGCNERGMIILWKNKYITNEQFADYMDLDYDDGDFWLVADDFDDILGSKYETEINILDGEMDWWEPSFYSKYSAHEIGYHWSDYTEDTLKAIIENCIKNGLEINEELITSENTTLKDGDIYFNDERLFDYLDDDDLDELRKDLSIAISEAQDAADQDEIYRRLKKSFVNTIGQYKHKSFTNKNGKTVEKLLIKFNDFSTIEDWLIEEYGEYEFEDENYGNILYILKEKDYFEFDTPDYNYMSGSIDDSLLNEITQSRLDY